MKQSYRIGVDVGGTKIEATAIDAASSVRARRRVATPIGNYSATIAAIVELVRCIETDIGAKASVGIGIPGTISPETNLVKNANSTWLIGKPFREDVAIGLSRPVRVANDANCFALSEATDGAAAGLGTVFGVILGTGVGGALVIDGNIVVGANAIAGEWGHNPLPWLSSNEAPGPLCYCGRRGCIETFLSGPALVTDYGCHPARRITGPEIADLAARGDPAASAAIERYTERLARGLASVINLLDPDAIVLGGGLSGLTHLYERVPLLWGPYIFSDSVVTKLLPPVHGDSSGVRGAAWLWPPGEG
jgi:fructokinase